MQQWEYAVAYGRDRSIQKVMKDGKVVKMASLELTAMLGELGRGGWEHYDSITTGEQFMLLFIRPLQSSLPQ